MGNLIECIDNDQVIYREAQPLCASKKYPIPDLKTETIRLKKGSIKHKGAKPLYVNMEILKDQPVEMRDGILLYADVYRNADEKINPTLLVFTPYSKSGGIFNNEYSVTKVGIKNIELSGLQIFEACDPDYWCSQSYNVVVIDARGMGQSQGDYKFMGHAQGIDVYDSIEWIAKQPWSTGKIGMIGNSQLGMIQWCAAAENPPHLTAIAPSESYIDIYRNVINSGGIPHPIFRDVDILDFVYGKNKWEDVTAMLEKYPTQNYYWKNKVPKIKKIKIPVYVSASWTHPIHKVNTLKIFEKLTTKEKWLRIHNTQGWVNLFDTNHLDELTKFFNHYLKEEKNDWKETPKIRYAVLDLGTKKDVFRSTNSFSIEDIETKELFLDAKTNTLKDLPVNEIGFVRYNSKSNQECARFEYKIDEEMEIRGASNLRIQVETDRGNDMDLYASIYKKDSVGKIKYHIMFPSIEKKIKLLMLITPPSKKLPGGPIYAGPRGRLRVSHRGLDTKKSTNLEPYLSHEKIEKISPNDTIEVNLGLSPTGMLLHEGDILIVEIGGKIVGPIADIQVSGEEKNRKIESVNEGNHTIRTGGLKQSRLFLPIVKLN